MAHKPARHPQSTTEDSSNGSEHSTSQELHGGAKKASKKQLQRSFVESESESDENGGLPPPPQPTHKSSSKPKAPTKPTPSKAAAAGASSASAKTHKKLKPSVSAPPPSKTKEDKKRLSMSNTKEDNKKRKLPSASAANPAEAAPPPPPLPSPTNNAVAETTHTAGTAARDIFDRIWTAEDELTLLEGLSTFMSNHDGKEPVGTTGISVLYDSLRTSFSRNFSQSQFFDKYYGMKRKYTRKRNNGKFLYALQKKNMDDVKKKMLHLAIQIWGKEQKEVNISTAGRQNSMPKLLRPKKEFVEKGGATHLPSSSGANPGRPISQKESVSSLSDSPFVDFVASWLDCMHHDSVRTIIANMSSDECRMLEEIWERFTQIEMNYQAHRLDTVSSIITIIKDHQNC